LVLLIVCAGAMLASLDLFIVNVALPQMSRDLGAHNLSGLSWVLNGYTIIYASLLVLFGRLAEPAPRARLPAGGRGVHGRVGSRCALAL
jgi:MFS family permease